MTPRLDPFASAPALMQAWLATTRSIAESLDPSLAHLVEIRASQINACANCLNMHTTAARAAGETEERLQLLAAWREAPCYTDRERAALAWTEALTLLAEGHERLEVYDALAAEFSEAERVNLTLLINAINGWNRICVGFGLWLDPALAARQAAA